MQIQDLETPALLVDKKVVKKNINRIQNIANKAYLKLRPHIKTHKSTRLYNWQSQAGAVGITASKVDEAIPFIEAGVSSVTFAYPIVDKRKLKRLISHIPKGNELDIRLSIDSPLGLEVAHEVATQQKVYMSIFFLVNVGSDRCGFEPKDNQMVDLANRISRYKYLHFAGLLSHNGLTYSAKNIKHLSKLNKAEIKQLLKIKKKLNKKGIEVADISTGSTPGIFGDSNTLSGVTEIRPGNYIFMDRTPVEMGLVKKKQVGLTILAQVISENYGYYIIDAGKKTLSSDVRHPGGDYGWAYPLNQYPKKKKQMSIVKLSEEHGFIKKRDGVKLEIGDKVRILPNHSCVVANLGTDYCLVENDLCVETISIDARGTSLGMNEVIPG